MALLKIYIPNDTAATYEVKADRTKRRNKVTTADIKTLLSTIAKQRGN